MSFHDALSVPGCTIFRTRQRISGGTNESLARSKNEGTAADVRVRIDDFGFSDLQFLSRPTIRVYEAGCPAKTSSYSSCADACRNCAKAGDASGAEACDPRSSRSHR